MGLPNYENQKIELINKFDLGELETVHEKSDTIRQSSNAATIEVKKKR